MADLKDKEEQLKDRIFQIFLDFQNDTSSDRRQVHYGQFTINLYKWCRDYLSFNVDNMGVEISKIADLIIRKESNANVPKEKAEFFKYLLRSLHNKEKEYYRNNNTQAIKIPKENRKMIKKVDAEIEKKESELGRTLTCNERNECISRVCKNTLVYNLVVNALNIGNFDTVYDDTGNKLKNPLDELISNYDIETYKKAVKYVLDKKQTRSRDCYRALFTVFWFETFKNNKDYIEGLASILDKDIFDMCQKNGKAPNQYEVYQKYHPEAPVKNANVSASSMLSIIKKELYDYLQELN